MRFCHNLACLALGFVLAACGQAPTTGETAAEAPAASAAGMFSFETYAGGEAPVLLDGSDNSVSAPITWFICATDGPDIFVASSPDASGAFQLARYSKTTFQAERRSVTLGEPFDGPKGPARGFSDAGGMTGMIYTLDPARMSSPNAATLAPVIGIDLDGEEFYCSWIEYPRFIGFTGLATYIVHGADDANLELYVFRFSDDDAPLGVWEHEQQGLAPGITAEHGAPDADQAGGAMMWTFENASDGKTYFIHTVADAPGTVQISGGGEVTTTDELQAYALPGRR